MSDDWDRSGWPNFKSLQRSLDFEFILEVADDLREFRTIKEMGEHLSALRPHRTREGWQSLM